MLQQAFGYPVGFSDHTMGYSIPLAAVTLGACIIEKHFTTDKDLPGWDHMISADPVEMKVIVKESAVIKEAMGSFRRTVSEAEMEKRLKFRRSIVATKELQPGHKIQLEDLDFKRPGTGISPDKVHWVLGKELKRQVGEDDLLNWNDLG
jgi:sialic acid synthase SpsE